MTTLILSLSAALPHATTLCEGVLRHDGPSPHPSVEPVQTPLTLLPTAPNLEIVALVPADQLSWHRLTLPRGALKAGLFQESHTSRLRAVLDGLLEDRVLDDTSQLHFAIEPQPQPDTPVWVAACNRAWLHAWLAALAEAGRPASRIVPELTPLGPEHASLQVISAAEPDQARLLQASSQGVTLLPLSAASAALLAWSEDAPLLAEPAVAALAEHFFNRPATAQSAQQRWLAAAQSDWDLAQFDLLYTRGTRTRKRLAGLLTTLLRAPRWRAARWATVALLAVNLLGLQAWAWKQQSALTAQRTAIRDTLTTTFPEVRVVVDAPLQMARALADLQRRNGTASAADLETMLTRLQVAAPELPAPAAIEFNASELRLKGLDNAAGLTGATAKLQAQGYGLRLEADTLVMKPERQP